MPKLRTINPDVAPLTVNSSGRNRYGLDATEEKYAQMRAQGDDPAEILAKIAPKLKSAAHYERHRPLVTARILQLQDEAAFQVVEKIKIDKEVIARETWEMYQACKVIYTAVDKNGNEEIAPVRANEALKALELLAKLEGLLVQKSEVRVGTLDTLSDDELTRIARQLAEEIGVDSGLVRIEGPPGSQ